MALDLEYSIIGDLSYHSCYCSRKVDIAWGELSLPGLTRAMVCPGFRAVSLLDFGHPQDWRVVRVSFRQFAAVPVDDLHVLGRRDGEEVPSLELRIAVHQRGLYPIAQSGQPITRSIVSRAGISESRQRDRGSRRSRPTAIAGPSSPRLLSGHCACKPCGVS